MLKRSGCQATVQGLGESEKTLDREAGEVDTVRPGAVHSLQLLEQGKVASPC